MKINDIPLFLNIPTPPFFMEKIDPPRKFRKLDPQLIYRVLFYIFIKTLVLFQNISG